MSKKLSKCCDWLISNTEKTDSDSYKISLPKLVELQKYSGISCGESTMIKAIRRLGFKSIARGNRRFYFIKFTGNKNKKTDWAFPKS